MDDLRWKQRAKRHWFSHGDRNTKFFHAWANHRRKKNYIGSILDEEGTLWTKQEDIDAAFINYFQSLYTSASPSGIEDSLGEVQHRVTAEMNASLLQEFTSDEVHIALSQMHPLKSPGPDGFSVSFYQRHWATVGREVCAAVLSFLNSGNLDAELNSTFIALIPKVSPSTKVTEFRSISLCNVLYKLIAKVLANRLKQILPVIISRNQSAFIPGRLICDNVLVAYEVLHTMNSRLKGKKGFMAIKFDISKAYDRVEWNYLEAIMRKMGFAEQWILLIMACVRTVCIQSWLMAVPKELLYLVGVFGREILCLHIFSSYVERV
ncbi:hypothetical protein SLA2020_390010 [Shorea laevis]